MRSPGTDKFQMAAAVCPNFTPNLKNSCISQMCKKPLVKDGIMKESTKKNSYILRSNPNIIDSALVTHDYILSMHSFFPMLKDLISRRKSCVTKLMTTGLFF